MKRKAFRFIVLAILTATSLPIQAQENVLKRIEELLKEGDCESAQSKYNDYKTVYGQTDMNIERRIADCKKNNIKEIEKNDYVSKTKKQIVVNGYVDLGLPSGTLWKNENEPGTYSHEKALKVFGDKLPTKELFEELRKNCKWEWNGAGYKIVGANGNHIFLPASGYNGCGISVGIIHVGEDGRYWSSTGEKRKYAFYLSFDKYGYRVERNNGEWCPSGGYTVRLVRYK